MKILHINTEHNTGGTADFINNLSSFQNRNGNYSKIIVKENKTEDESVLSFLKKNYFHKKISSVSKKIFKKDIPSFVIYNIRDIFRKIISNDIEYFQKTNLRLIKTDDFDIIHLHNLHGDYFNLNDISKLSKKIPVVWTIHDMWPITGHCAHSLDCRRWEESCGSCPYLKSFPSLFWDNTKRLLSKKKEIYKRSDLSIVVPSRWMKNKLEKSILKNKKLFLIHHGIDRKIFFKKNKKETRESLNLPLDKKIILFVANLGNKNPWKGWSFFEEIANHYSSNNNMVFICLGGRNDRSVNENIVFVDYIEDKKIVADYYNASDILLNTSIAESFSLVIVESLACSLPVVSFPVGVAEEAIENYRNGYIAKTGNVNDLIVGIEFFLEKGEMSEDISKDFSLKFMTEEYQNVYNYSIENFNKK